MKKKLALVFVSILILVGGAYFLVPGSVSATNFRDGTLQFQFYQNGAKVSNFLKNGGVAKIRLELKTCDPDLDDYMPKGPLLPTLSSIYGLVVPGGSDHLNQEAVKAFLRPAIQAVKTAKGDPWTEYDRPYDWKVNDSTGKIVTTGSVEKGDWTFADDRWQNTTFGDPAQMWTPSFAGLDPRGDSCGGSNGFSSMWPSWYQKAWVSLDVSKLAGGDYHITFCHGPRDDNGSRTDCPDSNYDQANFTVIQPTAGIVDVDIENDAGGNLRDGLSSAEKTAIDPLVKYEFVSPPQDMSGNPRSFKAYESEFQGAKFGKYAIKAHDIPGYTLVGIKDGKGNTISTANTAEQWLCSQSGAGTSCPPGTTSLLKNVYSAIASYLGKQFTVLATMYDGRGPSQLSCNPGAPSCATSLGGGEGGGGGINSQNWISFSLIYKKAAAVSACSPANPNGICPNGRICQSGACVSNISNPPTGGGTLSFDPATVPSNGNFGFSISLTGGPANKTASHLWISTSINIGGNYGDFLDFGPWSSATTNAGGNFTLNRTLNCSAYTSYQPGQTSDIRGKKLYQQVKIQWPDGSYSSVGSHIKDCTGVQSPGEGGGTVGTLVFIPTTVQNNEAFTIEFKYGPANATPHLWIKTSENDDQHYGDFADFGSWSSAKTDASGSFGPINRTLNCSAYTSYIPGQTKDITGKKLYQQVKLQWPDKSYSNAANHVKDCTVGGGGGGGGGAQTLCGTPDPTKSGICILPGQVCEVGAGGNFSCVTPGAGGGGPIGNVSVTYKIDPPSGSVAVGQSISFTASEIYSNGDPTIDVTSKAEWQTDAFYLKSGATKGTFIGVNPGTTSIHFVGRSGGPGAYAQVAVTGSPSSAQGKIKITASKDITKTLFPDPNCNLRGKNCVVGANNTLRVIPSSGGSQLIADSWMSTVDFPAKGDAAQVILYSLADPMNPAPNAPYTAKLTAEEDTAGDYGPYMSIAYGEAASKDGSYQFAAQNQGMLYGFQDGTKRLMDFDVRPGGGIYDVLEYGDNVYLLMGQRVEKVTDLASMPLGTHGYVSSVSRIPPSSFPKLGVGPKIIMDSGYLASISVVTSVSGGNVSYSSPKLGVFKLGQSSAVANIDVGSIFPNFARGNISNYAIPKKNFFFHTVSNDQYIFLILPASYASNYSDPSWSYKAQKLYAFKFNGANLTKVIDGLVLDPGLVRAATGIKVGDDVGIAVKLDKYLDSGEYVRTENRVKIYLLSDLLSGTVQDVLSNSPVTTEITGAFASDKLTAYEADNTTYLYVGGGGLGGIAPVYVWKLGSGNAGEPTNGGPGGGGGPTSAANATCNFTLTPANTPTSDTATISAGSNVTAVYTLKSSSAPNANCLQINLALPVINNNTINTRMIYADNSYITMPFGGSTVLIFNTANVPVGTYTLPVKAKALGVPEQTINLKLIAQ